MNLFSTTQLVLACKAGYCDIAKTGAKLKSKRSAWIADEEFYDNLEVDLMITHELLAIQPSFSNTTILYLPHGIITIIKVLTNLIINSGLISAIPFHFHLRASL